MSFKELLSTSSYYDHYSCCDYCVTILLWNETSEIKYKCKWNPYTKIWTYEVKEMSPVLEKEFPLFQKQLEKKLRSESLEERKESERFFEKIHFLHEFEHYPIEEASFSMSNEHLISLRFIVRDEYGLHRILFHLNKEDLSFSTVAINYSKEDYMIFTPSFIQEHLPGFEQVKEKYLQKHRIRLLFR